MHQSRIQEVHRVEFLTQQVYLEMLVCVWTLLCWIIRAKEVYENDRIDIENTSLYGNHTSRQSKKETCQTYTTKVKNASQILPMSAIHIANNTIDQNEIKSQAPEGPLKM